MNPALRNIADGALRVRGIRSVTMNEEEIIRDALTCASALAGRAGIDVAPRRPVR
jgi:hypothetical protein